MSTFLLFLLNDFRVSVILKCLGNFDQMRGPIQLFQERLSEKVHATISKGIVGGFECTVP